MPMCVQIAMVDDLPNNGLVLAERAGSGYVVAVDVSLFAGDGSLTDSGIRFVALALASLREQLQSIVGEPLAPAPLRSVAG